MAATPAALAAECDAVLVLVVNAAQTEQVLFGPGGAATAMRPGSVFVMCSTASSWVLACASRVSDARKSRPVAPQK